MEKSRYELKVSKRRVESREKINIREQDRLAKLDVNFSQNSTSEFERPRVQLRAGFPASAAAAWIYYPALNLCGESSSSYTTPICSNLVANPASTRKILQTYASQ